MLTHGPPSLKHCQIDKCTELKPQFDFVSHPHNPCVLWHLHYWKKLQLTLLQGYFQYRIADDVDFNGDIELLPAIGPDDDLLEVINKRINEALADSELNGDAKTGILLVSHGSRLKYNKEFISEVYRKFSETTEYPSNFGFMELVEPNIPTSINKLINENEIDRLVVVPVFIAPGVHTTSDIPTILGLKEADSHSHSHSHEHGHEHHHHHHHDLEAIDFEGEILYPEPIGSDNILIDILVKNMEKAL